MKSKGFAWTSLTSRRHISIPAALAGSVLLVGAAVLVTTRLVATPALAQATGSTPPVAAMHSSFTPAARPASFVSNKAPTQTPGGLGILDIDDRDEQQPAPATFAGIAQVIESAGSLTAANDAMSNQDDFISEVATTPRSGRTNWQSDPRWQTMINTNDHRITTDQTGAEFDIAFIPVTETGMARSLLASASFALHDHYNSYSLTSQDSQGDDQSIVDTPLIHRGRGINSLLGDSSTADLGGWPDLESTVDVVPKSDSDASPPDQSDVTPGKSPDNSVDPSNIGDLSRGPGVTGPISGLENNVPEPFTIPILLVGWLLLFRAKRNRLDLAKLEQLLQESGSMKLPPGSSDLTRAQLQATSRRTVTPRD